MLNCLFVNPNSSKIYQKLGEVYSAIETPTWSLLLAQSCRSVGYDVAILDADAERLTDEESLARIEELQPKLVCFVVYGQNPNSGTTNMTGALSLAKLIKENSDVKIAFVGSHTSALPEEVLAYKCVDFVLVGDGVYALRSLLDTDMENGLHKIGGLGWKNALGSQLNGKGSVVPTNKMDVDLPGYAWDLLPFKEKPLDLYRAHFWHANYDHAKRTPFAAIYSSLGCQFKCQFCMINQINKTDISDAAADQYNGMRFWSPEFMIGVVQELVEKYGVETIRFSDEMFFLNKKYYEPLIDLIIERDYKINTWTYSRIDTVKPSMLAKFKQAGVNWLALGIEAANQTIRREITKGKFEDINIRDVCKVIRENDIAVIGNYIFGFPGEKLEDLQATLNLAMELNTECANFYTATALPGSPLYHLAKQNNWKIPSTFEGFGFLAYEFEPLPTNYMEGKDVLAFRDAAWHKYFENEQYLKMIEAKFGAEQRRNIEIMSKIKLKRKAIGN